MPYYEGTDNGTLWEHLKLAFRTPGGRDRPGPHGGYLAGATGDWNDFSTEFKQMTESMLVTAQPAYSIHALALFADHQGDTAFAAQLRAAGATTHHGPGSVVTGGWYSRGYSGHRQVGAGSIF